MFLRKKILKRGASKALLTRFKLNINFLNLACFFVGSITGCLAAILCSYLFSIDFTKKTNNSNTPQDISIAEKQNNLPAMPKFKFYYYLAKNNIEDNPINKTDNALMQCNLINNNTELNKHLVNNNIAQKPKSQTSKQTVFYLQIGILKSLKQAQTIASKIECLGFVSVIEKIKIHTKKDWFRVEIGPFFNLEEIDKAQNKISNQDINNTLFQYRKKIMY